jgi:hypothetical protein
MNSDDKFILWSDGSFTSIGIDASSGLSYTGNSKILVKDPMIVIFSTSEEVDKKTGEKQSRLNFEMVPYLFGALLTEGENIWEIDARCVLQNNSIIPGLKAIYYHTVEGTSKVKRNANGEVEITPTK